MKYKGKRFKNRIILRANSLGAKLISYVNMSLILQKIEDGDIFTLDLNLSVINNEIPVLEEIEVIYSPNVIWKTSFIKVLIDSSI